MSQVVWGQHYEELHKTEGISKEKQIYGGKKNEKMYILAELQVLKDDQGI